MCVCVELLGFRFVCEHLLERANIEIIIIIIFFDISVLVITLKICCIMSTTEGRNFEHNPSSHSNRILDGLISETSSDV